MARDVGSYFEQLTRKARGGRRLGDVRPTGTPSRGDDRRAQSNRPSRSRSDGLADALKDVLGRG